MKKQTSGKKGILLLITGIALIAFVATNAVLLLLKATLPALRTQAVALKSIGTGIVAAGAVHSQNEATLHFQTGGRLVYLPFQQGDKVLQGQTIAQLDTYALQRELTQALNTYRSTRDTFDQTQANSQTGVLQGSQKSALNIYNQNVIGGGVGEDNAINDAVKRIIDQNQASLDNSVINVELANYALELATLTAPFNGVVTAEDVTTAYQNITPATSFSLADPSQLVFRANVDASDIDYVSLGAPVTIHINGFSKPLSATVSKIYPQKTTLPSGEEVYQVDVQGNSLQQIAKLGQGGSVVIASNAQASSVTVPTWTILNHNQIWVEENNKPLLKTVTIGKAHGNVTEVTGGLLIQDKVIIDPAAVAALTYEAL